MALKELLEKISTPGDVAASAIGYALGFAADVFLFPGGVTSGTVAAVSAVGALGIKKAIDARISRELVGGKDETVKVELEKKAKSLVNFLERAIEQPNLENHKRDLFKELRRRLRQQMDLWESGVLENDEFKDQLSEFRLTCIEQIGLLQDLTGVGSLVRRS